jgi:hypothetical protein
MNKIYGTEFMAKSLTFIWEHYGVDTESNGKILGELTELVDAERSKVICRRARGWI